MKNLPAGELLSRKETAQKAFISRISAIPCCHRHDSRESDCNEPKKPKTENAQATTINKKKTARLHRRPICLNCTNSSMHKLIVRTMHA